MNVGGIPLNQDSEDFWIRIILLAVLTGIEAWGCSGSMTSNSADVPGGGRS
jgi:hypothetical protein